MKNVAGNQNKPLNISVEEGERQVKNLRIFGRCAEKNV